MDRVAQFGVIAAREAIAHSGLTFEGGLSEQTATIIGCGVGGQSTQDENYKRLYGDKAKRLHPLTIPKLMVNAPASQISMSCGLRGPAFVVASACASATHAIGLAFHMVRSGSVPVAVTGGAEACIAFGTMKGWEALRVLAPDTCRPFSRDRKGLVIGEGAAAIVIESLEHAKKRSANILGEIVGFGMTADAGDLLSPDAGGMLRAINGALTDGGLNASDVQYVNAHGTGTAANDETETDALKRAFGDHARQARDVVEQVDDRPRAGRCRRAGDGRDADDDQGRHRAADHQLSRPGSGLRHRLRAERGAADAGRCRAVEFVCVRRAQRRAGGEAVFVSAKIGAWIDAKSCAVLRQPCARC